MSRTKLLSVIGQKISYMNLSVVGNPTINNGVVSGFSANNYLILPKFDKTKKWEIVLCFTTPETIVSGKGLFVENTATSYKTRLNINVNANGFAIFITSNGSSYNIANTSVSNVLVGNTQYCIKIQFTETQYIYSLKSSGYYSVIATFNSTEVLRDLAWILGKEASNAWNGTFNINKSYAISDGTKYIFTLP